MALKKSKEKVDELTVKEEEIHMAGLVSRVCPGGTKYGAVDSPG